MTPEITYKSNTWKDFDWVDDVVNQSCHAVISKFDITGAEVSIVLADDEFVQSMNKQYRNKDKTTNVLSFPALDEHNDQQLGDIIIAFETTKRESTEQDKEFKNHFTHLIIHGLLHLLGYDHLENVEAEEMENLEKQILGELGIGDPYNNMELLK